MMFRDDDVGGIVRYTAGQIAEGRSPWAYEEAQTAGFVDVEVGSAAWHAGRQQMAQRKEEQPAERLAHARCLVTGDLPDVSKRAILPDNDKDLP